MHVWRVIPGSQVHTAAVIAIPPQHDSNNWGR